jgi:hypothetical protein
MKKSIVCAALMFASAAAFAQKPAVVASNEPGWEHIGQTTASFKMQNESIVVLGADEFTAIRIKVKDAPIDIERLQVFYESGDMEEIDVDDLNANGESEVIRLKHPDRDIKKVSFTYKTAANAKGEKADVALYGLKTNQPQGSDAYRDNKEKVENDVERAAERTEDDIEDAADDVEDETEKAGDDIERESEEAERKAEKTGSELGNDIKEGVNDAGAAIKDKKLKNKVGPGGETAYIDDNGKYYYINDQGKKVFISELQLKDKPDNK